MTLGDGPAPAHVPSAERRVAASGPEPTRRPAYRGVLLLSVVSLAIVTLVPLGATRMYASPWLIAYFAALLGPACLLILRSFDVTMPLRLPAPRWTALVGVSAAAAVISALITPFRTPAILWSSPLVGAAGVFFVVHDWVMADPAKRRDQLWQTIAAAFMVIVVASLGEWLSGIRTLQFDAVMTARNPYPLGHANYTAGLAVLALPAFAYAAARTAFRWPAILGAVLAIAMLFTSGSRGGLIGAAAVAVIAGGLSRATWRTKFAIAGVAVVAAALFFVANPRTRSLLHRASPGTPPNLSSVQRQAMLHAGVEMGSTRPVFGWGPGTTPLVYPRYRARLEGGAEDVLQLHNLPVQLWAELGLLGVACAVALLGLVIANARHDPFATTALLGYAIFALSDAQLDVPVFGFAVAMFAALAARPRNHVTASSARFVGVCAVALVALISIAGRRDPTPAWNVEALRLDDGRPSRDRAIALLNDSLARNPDQEIAHFNLGWMLVVSDPLNAAGHFAAAARLVPDKGGVYFGLGLARLNAGNPRGAAVAFAVEAINDPVFLLSPWWQRPELAAVRPETLRRLAALQDALVAQLPEDTWAGREARYVRAFDGWVVGSIDAQSVAAAANTAARQDFFRRAPSRSVLDSLGTQVLRRQRIGYPVLMRDLDLAPPYDAWVVEESNARSSKLSFLWPDKGWVPSPHLLRLAEGAPD